MSSLIRDMANLLCIERTDQPRGIEDPVLGRVEVGECLVHLQNTTVPQFDYFTLQPHIKPFMRTVVGNWMLAVCNEQNTEDTIFPLAMNYFDRFLCTTAVIKTQLQLVGAVCILLASKMRQYRCFSPQLLSEYTEFSVTPREIEAWELVLLEKLGWDLSPPIPNDFLDYALVRCRIPLSKTSLVRKNSLAFIFLTILDPSTITMKPSLIAAGALGTTARNLGYVFPADTMAEIIEDDKVHVEQAIALVERLFEETATSEDPVTQPPNSPTPSPIPEEYISPFKPTSEADVEYYDGNETPTDLIDIEF